MKKLIVLLAILTIAGCQKQSLPDIAGPTILGPVNVEYRVTGSTATADVTYQNSSEGTSQQSGVSIPWSYSFTKSTEMFLYISAQKDGNPSTDVTVTIYKNGSVFKTSTSSGAYVIADAYGDL